MWRSAINADDVKSYYSSTVIKASITETERSLVERLKACYLFDHRTNPQLDVSRRSSSYSCCIVSIVCTAILLREIFRCFVSKELEFHKGRSDYKWSMQGIVVSQSITVLMGSFGTTTRFLSMAKHLLADEFNFIFEEFCPAGRSTSMFLAFILHPFIITIHLLLFLCFSHHLDAVGDFCEKARESVEGTLFNFCDEPKDGIEVEDMNKECKALISSPKTWESDEWAFKKGVKEMMRFMSKRKLPIHLIQLLHKTPPSQVPLMTLLQNQRLPGSEEYQISPVSIFVLAKIIMLSIPLSMSQCTYDSLKDFFVAIQYISNKGNNREISIRNNIFEYVWSSNLYFGFFNDNEKPKQEEDFQSQMQLDQTLEIIRDVKLKSENECFMHSLSLKEEIDMISEFIESKAYASIQDLYQHMEQLFVDMIMELLLQLSAIVLKEIVESSREDFEEKVIEAFKLVSIFEQLRNLDAFSFLVGTTIITTNSATYSDVEGEDKATLENNANVTTTADAYIRGIPNTQSPLEVYAVRDYESRLVVFDDVQHEIIQIE
ncbi:hypothetical protein Sjap_009055 [Stephania japonica]|uniref:Uncharacterized protein n=1 Tax=Stephania japonica TaxID=461633 RepID=A0AAP0PF25_9MAGN